MSTQILDISYYQSPFSMDYDKLAKQIDGVIIRAGYTGYVSGKGATDNYFERHYAEFNKRNVDIGFYWIVVGNNTEMGRREAQECLKRVRGKEFNLPIYADSEWVYEDYAGEANYRPQDYSRETLTAAVLAFCETIAAAGYNAGIYASESWFTGHLNMEPLRPYSWWVANYSRQPSIAHDLWQYTSTEKLNGYSGNLDMSHCYVDIRRKENTQNMKVELYTPWLKKKAIVTALQDPARIVAGKRYKNPFSHLPTSWKDGYPYPNHVGIDFGVPTGTPIYALVDGKVWTTTEARGGKCLQILAGGKAFTARHLSEFVVSSGYVTKGQLVAYSGNTGAASTGPHLHVDVFDDNGCHDAFPYVTGIWDENGNVIDKLDDYTPNTPINNDDYEYMLKEPIAYRVDINQNEFLNVRREPNGKVISKMENGKEFSIDKRCDLPNGEKWGRLSGQPWNWVCLFDGEHWFVNDPIKKGRQYILKVPHVYITAQDIQGYSLPQWNGGYKDSIWKNTTFVVIERCDEGENLFGKAENNVWYELKNGKTGWNVKGGWAVTDNFTTSDGFGGNYYDCAQHIVNTSYSLFSPSGEKLA